MGRAAQRRVRPLADLRKRAGCVDTSSHAFGLVFLPEGWRHRLFDDWEGLQATSPSWYLVPLMVWIAWKHPQRRLLFTVLAGACGYTLLMLTFSYWESANGPRFVFPLHGPGAAAGCGAARKVHTPQGRKVRPIDTAEVSH